MAEDFPQKTRAILNANRGIANVIDYNVIKDDLQGVADKIFNILKGHYGPFSGFAAIDNGDPLQETKFSKDGIGIVRAVEFASPQEDWVRKTIAYIGTKIESAVGDGTTSSMMFTCAMLKHMLEHIDEIKPISYNYLRDHFTDFIKNISEIYEHVATYTVKDSTGKATPDRIYKIVYNQVYTSSHGDVELAKALANIYTKTPEELWDRMVYERRTQESEERFVVRESEGQYQMTCDVMMNGMLNKDFSTWFEADNCKVFVMNDTIRTSCDSWDKIVDAMRVAETGKPFVLISHKRMDANSYQEFMGILDECVKAGKSIAIFQTDPKNPRVNDFISIMLLAGLEVTKAVKNRDNVLEMNGIRVKWKQHELSLDNIYEVPEEYKDSLKRPHNLDGKHMQFTDYAEAVKELADGYAKADQDNDTREQMNMLYRMYAKLMYQKTAILQIGGKALDNIALVDVVDDCVRAASRALKHGIVLGNNRTLWFIAEECTNDRTFGKIEQWFLSRIKEALEDIACATISRIFPPKNIWDKFMTKFSRGRGRKARWAREWYHHSVNLVKYTINNRTLMSEDNFIRNLPGAYKFIDDARDNPIIVQPANADISMLERFGEVALKYVLTERIIVRGTAYVDPSRSKK